MIDTYIFFSIPPEWNEFTYCIGLMAANKTTWDKMCKKLELYQKSDPEKEKLLKSLNYAENSNIIIDYLNITFNTSLFQKNHFLMFKSILNKHSNNNLILDYILNNFEIIKPK